MVEVCLPCQGDIYGEVCLHYQGDSHGCGVPSMSGRYPWVRCAFYVKEIYMGEVCLPVREISMGEVCLPCQGDIHG